jgi:hypothetical protein
MILSLNKVLIVIRRIQVLSFGLTTCVPCFTPCHPTLWRFSKKKFQSACCLGRGSCSPFGKWCKSNTASGTPVKWCEYGFGSCTTILLGQRGSQVTLRCIVTWARFPKDTCHRSKSKFSEITVCQSLTMAFDCVPGPPTQQESPIQLEGA